MLNQCGDYDDYIRDGRRVRRVMRGVMRAWYEVEAGQSAVTGTTVRALV